MRRAISSFILVSLLGLTGCTFEREGPPAFHFQEFQAREPRGNTVYVCSAYGCAKQTPVNFSSQLPAIAELMKKTKKADSAAEERRAIAYAVGFMETYA